MRTGPCFHDNPLNRENNVNIPIALIMSNRNRVASVMEEEIDVGCLSARNPLKDLVYVTPTVVIEFAKFQPATRRLRKKAFVQAMEASLTVSWLDVKKLAELHNGVPNTPSFLPWASRETRLAKYYI